MEGLLKGEKQKKSRGAKMEAFSSTEEMAGDRLSPSRKLKRSLKQHVTSYSDPGNHATGWGCNCRNSYQKC